MVDRKGWCFPNSTIVTAGSKEAFEVLNAKEEIVEDSEAKAGKRARKLVEGEAEATGKKKRKKKKKPKKKKGAAEATPLEGIEGEETFGSLSNLGSIFK